MEAARAIDYLHDKGVLIVNNLKINSMVTLNGKIAYPKDIIPTLSKQIKTIEVNATETAIELGNSKVMNIIMLGALVTAMDLANLDFETAIKENIKPKFIELNLKAFKIGCGIL